MKIGLVASVKPSHPYLENDPAPLFDLHYLRISPWLWFRKWLTFCCTLTLPPRHRFPVASSLTQPPDGLIGVEVRAVARQSLPS